MNETKNNGSEIFKHVSTKVLLENAAVDMRIIFDVLTGNSSDFDVYVKLFVAAGEDEDTLDWLKIDKYDKMSANYSDFREYDLSLSKHCSAWTDTTQYVSFRVKLVGRASNTSQPVIFQNLRAIAIT